MTAIYCNIPQYWFDWQGAINLSAPVDLFTEEQIADMLQITINGEQFEQISICPN